MKAKKFQLTKLLFLKPKSALKATGYDQMKVSGRRTEPKKTERRYFPRSLKKQAGTGPSRRHIQGSKIAKRLPSVKYSLLQYSKIKNLSQKKFRKNYILKKMDQVARRGPLARDPGALTSHNAEKLKGGTL